MSSHHDRLSSLDCEAKWPLSSLSCFSGIFCYIKEESTNTASLYLILREEMKIKWFRETNISWISWPWLNVIKNEQVSGDQSPFSYSVVCGRQAVAHPPSGRAAVLSGKFSQTKLLKRDLHLMIFIICEDGPYTGIDRRMFSLLGSCDCNQMSVRLKSILIMGKWAGPSSDSRWETRRKHPTEYPKDGHTPELDVSRHKHGRGSFVNVNVPFSVPLNVHFIGHCSVRRQNTN